MVIIAVLVSFLSISALLTSQFGRFMGRQQGNNDLMAAADAGLEYAYGEWARLRTKTNSRRAVTFTLSTADLNSTSALPFNANGIVLHFRDDHPRRPERRPAAATPSAYQTSNVPHYPGWTGTAYNYLATIKVTYDRQRFALSVSASDGIPSLTTHRVFQYTQVPLFQAAIFYENKLEIHPGAAMVVNGLVHSNGDLWARGFSTLQFKSNVSYVGSLQRDRRQPPSPRVGTAAETGYIPGVGPFRRRAAGHLERRQDLLHQHRQGDAAQPGQPHRSVRRRVPNNNGLHDIVEVPTNNTGKSIAYNDAASVVITIDSSQAANSSDPPPELSPTTRVTRWIISIRRIRRHRRFKNAVNSGHHPTIFDQREGSSISPSQIWT